MDADRILKPIREAAAALDALDAYDSPAALADALRATSVAVDRTLRGLLRADVTAPDTIRMSAMSPEQTSSAEVLAELRRRDLITLELAGRVHALQQAVQRAAEGAARPADADHAADTVRLLEREVRAAATSHDDVENVDPPVPAAPARDAARPHDTRAADAGASRRSLLLVATAALVLVAVMVALWAVRGPSSMEQGIAAFAEGRSGIAEQHFRQAVEQDADNVTARLYLARILRGQGRHEEAARHLTAAAARAPEDAAVRRELGRLFLDLGRPEPAAEQFQRATELAPAEPLGWVGLVQSLRRMNSPSAEEVLRRAPADARAMLGAP